MTKLQKFAMVCCPSCSFKFFHSTKMTIYMGKAKWTPMMVYLMSEHWHQHYHHHCPLENSGALLSRIELPSRAMFSTPLTPALYITFQFSISWCFEHFPIFSLFSMFSTPNSAVLYKCFQLYYVCLWNILQCIQHFLLMYFT